MYHILQIKAWRLEVRLHNGWPKAIELECQRGENPRPGDIQAHKQIGAGRTGPDGDEDGCESRLIYNLAWLPDISLCEWCILEELRSSGSETGPSRLGGESDRNSN